MTKLIFITSAEVNYKLPGFSLYESIRRTAACIQFPHIVKDSRRDILKRSEVVKRDHPLVIYSAPSFQTQETAQTIGEYLGLCVLTEKQLMPLRFDLERLITKREFNSLGNKRFSVLRERFIEAFYRDQLLDSRIEIKSRFHCLTEIVSSKYKKNATILAVSHSYLIILFSLYYKLGDTIFKDKKALIKGFRAREELLKRLEIISLSL